jgi:hypothetical protein
MLSRLAMDGRREVEEAVGPMRQGGHKGLFLALLGSVNIHPFKMALMY